MRRPSGRSAQRSQAEVPELLGLFDALTEATRTLARRDRERQPA